tara:strand:+ start:351 stop:689 length:339 start_codon:yes stop_codon:yes gene_type:complete
MKIIKTIFAITLTALYAIQIKSRLYIVTMIAMPEMRFKTTIAKIIAIMRARRIILNGIVAFIARNKLIVEALLAIIFIIIFKRVFRFLLAILTFFSFIHLDFLSLCKEITII